MAVVSKNTLSAFQLAALTAFLLSTSNAFAQFRVIDQKATLKSSVSSEVLSDGNTTEYDPSQTASQFAGNFSNDLSSQNLTVRASVDKDFLVTGQASLRTIATSSVLGLSDDISLTFQQQATAIGQNLEVSGSVTVKASLAFWVDAPTDVAISVLLPTSPFVTPGSLYSNSSFLYLDTGTSSTIGVGNMPFPTGVLAKVQAQSGVTHLNVGKYVLEINSQFAPESGTNRMAMFISPTGITFGPNTFRTPTSLPFSASAITITAVPEPGTMALGLLGAFAGISLARRRLKNEQPQN